MFKLFKQITKIFFIALFYIIICNTSNVKAANLVTQEIRDEFASQTNETSYKVGYKYVEENGRYQYTLDHNSYQGLKYVTTYHDTLQDILDRTASNAIWVYEYLNNEEVLPKINLDFTTTVPLNESLVFQMPSTMYSIPGTLSYYITSSSNNGIVFDINKKTGSFSYLSSTYTSVERASNYIVVKSGNTSLELYFYDCKIIGITNIYQTYGADVYLDNAEIYFAGYDISTSGNVITKMPNIIELGKSLGNERSGNKFEVANYSAIGIYYPKFCYYDDCNDFSHFESEIHNYAQLTMSDDDLKTREYWVTKSVNIYNLNKIVVNGALTWDIADNAVITITNDNNKAAKLILHGNIDFYNGNLIENNPQIKIYEGISKSIEAYNLTHNYKYKIISTTSSNEFVFVEGDQESIDKFEVFNSHFEESVNPNDQSAPKVATTDIINNGNKKNLIMKFNYYKWNFSSNYNLTLSYSGYVEVGKSIKDSYYINSDGIYATQFENFQGSQHYIFDGYYLYGAATELGDYDSWIPANYNQTLTYFMKPKKYYFNFNESSLYGAVPYAEYITYNDIGNTHYFKTYFENYDHFDTTKRVLIGWSFTADGEIIDKFVPSKSNFENISMDSSGTWYLDLTLYARYDPKYEVIYRAHEATNYQEDVVRYVQKGQLTSTMSHIPPIRENAQFLYWYEQSNPEESFDFTQPITKSIILKAKWRERYILTLYSTEQVTWYKNNTVFTPSENNYVYNYYEDEVAYNADNISLTREDYIFQYWYYVVDSVEVRFNFEEYLTKNTVIYPKWQIEQYTIRFSKGTIGESDKYKDMIMSFPENKIVDKYTKITSPQIAEEIEDWEFDYWREVGKLERFDFNTQITKNITLEVVWKDVLYKINWIIKNPINNEDIEMTSECIENWDYFSTSFIDVKIKLPSNCISEENYPYDYIFAGWSYNQNAEANEVETYLDTSSETNNYRNLTIYAIWAKLYTVTFDNSSMDDSEVWYWCSTEIDCNDPLWFDGPMFSAGENDSYPTKLTQKVAKYSLAKNIYYIIYIGHNMLHWYANINDPTSPFDFNNTEITSNITLYPYFELKTINLTFAFENDDEKSKTNFENGNWPDNQSIKYGEKFNCPEVVLEYEHYTFLWWGTKENNGKYTKFDWDANWKSSWSPTLYPVWEASEYFITYDLTTPDGKNEAELTGQYTKVITIEMIGQSIDLPDNSNFSKLNDKYVFIEWINDNLEDLNELIVTNDILKDMTLIATYDIRKLTIKYELKAEVVSNEETEYHCIEYRDEFGVYHFGGPENVGYILSEIQCDYMKWEFTKDDDSIVVVNPKRLYVKNGKYFVSAWKLGNKVLDEGYVLTYDEALSKRGFKDDVTLYPVLTPSLINPDIQLSKTNVTIKDKTWIYSNSETGADIEYIFVLKLDNDKQYVLIDKYSSQDKAINFEMNLENLDIGSNKIVLLYIYNQELDFASITNYESLEGYYKLKYMFVVNLSISLIDFDEIVVSAYFYYDGTEKCLNSSNVNLPNGVSINCTPKVDAGLYTASVSIDNPKYYNWDDATTQDKLINWYIDKAYVNYKAYQGQIDHEFNYDGETKEVTIDMIVVQNLNSDEYEFSGTYKSNQAGWHTFTLTFTKNYMTDYIGDFSWYIHPKYVEVPLLIDGTKMKVYDSISEPFIFEPGKQKWELQDLFDEYSLERIDKNDIVLSGDSIYTGSGSYTIKVQLADSINYRWQYSTSVSINPSETNLHDDVEGTLYVWVNKRYMDLPKVIVDENEKNFYTYNITDYINYDGLSHDIYVEGNLIDTYYEASSIENAKNVGEYTLSVQLKYPNDTCWNNFGSSCEYSNDAEQNLKFTFIINCGYKDVFIEANVEYGHLWYKISGFHPSEVESIKFASNTQMGFDNGGFGDTFELVVGENIIYYEIIWKDSNYANTFNNIFLRWDGAEIKTQNYGDIFNLLTRPTAPNNDSSNSDSSENNSQDDSTNNGESIPKTSTGCSKSKGGKAYGDLVAIFSVLCIIFFKKKTLL